MESIPVKAYATGEQAYAAFPHIKQVIYPESMRKNNNTEAAPGAKVFYLWNKYAQEVCKEAANNIAGIVSMYPWIADKLPEKCCLHCAHYEPYYTRRDDSAACDARFTIAQEGRCRQSRNAKGKSTLAKSAVIGSKDDKHIDWRLKMNELMIFENNKFGQVRTVLKDGEPWFVAADVCRALELEQVTRALDRLDEDERGLLEITHPQNPNKELQVSAVNEPGLYALVLGSRKPEARAFKRWITHEVIPSIRKTGGYIAGEEAMTDDELLSRALQVMQRKLEQREARLQVLSVENARLAVENQIAAPKAAYFDELVDRKLLTNFRETAKELNIKERQFVGFLMDKKYIYRDKKGKLLPYNGKGDGLFEVKECFNEKTQWSGTQTMITPKGRETFRLLMQGMTA